MSAGTTAKGASKRKRCGERAADGTLANDGRERLFPCAVLAAPRIELVEDRLPLAADGLLPLVEVIDLLGGGLDLPRDLHLGRAEFFEAFTDIAPEERL